MDAFDRKILLKLQKNGRVSNKNLAESINLSVAPCLRRVKRLEDDGIIEGYHARLNTKKLGLKLTAYVQVTLDKHKPEYFHELEKSVLDYPEVLECHLMTGGEADYLLKLLLKDMDEYNSFFSKKLSTIKGVTNISSNFVMKSTVNSWLIPV